MESTRERFEAVYAAHYADVVRYARRRVDAAVVDDVTAEVFLIAWRRVQDVPAPALPWLYGVARRVVANQRRGMDRQQQLTERVGGSCAVTSPDPAPAVDSAVHFAAAFGSLSDDDRELLSLLVWEGLGPTQLGIALGCSTPAATMRLHRARRRLESALLDDAVDHDARGSAPTSPTPSHHSRITET